MLERVLKRSALLSASRGVSISGVGGQRARPVKLWVSGKHGVAGVTTLSGNLLTLKSHRQMLGALPPN